MDTFLSNRKEVIPSSFLLNQSILEEELRTPRMYPILEEIVPQMYPILKSKNPISKFRVGSPGQHDLPSLFYLLTSTNIIFFLTSINYFHLHHKQNPITVFWYLIWLQDRSCEEKIHKITSFFHQYPEFSSLSCSSKSNKYWFD